MPIARAAQPAVGSLVRTAIDVVYPAAAFERARAPDAILAADAMDAPTITDLVTELDELRGRRG